MCLLRAGFRSQVTDASDVDNGAVATLCAGLVVPGQATIFRAGAVRFFAPAMRFGGGEMEGVALLGKRFNKLMLGPVAGVMLMAAAACGGGGGGGTTASEEPTGGARVPRRAPAR
ncbi:hypothetical protein GCM10020001_059100 [Nonomuraea salmonea]